MDKKLVIKPEWCKGCGICVAFCPKKVLGLENEKIAILDGDSCIKCGQCEEVCPQHIKIRDELEKVAAELLG